MSAVAWGLAAAGAAVAAVSAVADGALLSENALPVSSDRGGAPQPSVARAVPAREQAHRALAYARVVGHLAAGCGLAVALELTGRPTLALVAALVLLGLATVLVAESTARVLGDALGEQAALRLAGFTRAVERVLWPVVALGHWMDGLFAEVVSESDATQERRDEAAQQFRDVVTSETDVSGDERALLLGVFEFGETTAEEVMVPRVDMLGVERETPWSEMVDRVRSIQHSRVPVYEETIDEIVGILYVKDLLPAVLADAEPEGGWTTLMRPPVFIPASKRIADLLREFRQARRHIAIVADEYGGTAGLVTIEDILEELVGEIRDEYDDEERLVENEDDERFWVSGRLTLDDLSAALGHEFSRDDVSTVGGLIMELLGRVPRAGESLVMGPFKVIVERVIRRKIERVYLERLPMAEAASDPDEVVDA
ncbi:hemolysin family protein [Gemmatimonas sp.]|jgi:putative hemolysin|uniref:hemolysin family protein n=1 Tax=Gemmatimonas sp. TaxID=1962908 RepID=UPI0037BFEB7C